MYSAEIGHAQDGCGMNSALLICSLNLEFSNQAQRGSSSAGKNPALSAGEPAGMVYT
jgi:hypothetical protein